MLDDYGTLAVKPATPAQMLKAELSALEWPREGGVVEAVLIRKEMRQAFFDLGKFGTGSVYGAEFLNARDILREMKPGDAFPVKILSFDTQGHVELSLTEAGKYRQWQQVQEFMESGEIVKVKVVAVNPGGLIANLSDLKAFLPLSQLSAEHALLEPTDDREKIMNHLKQFMGVEFAVKVISVNQKKNKLIVSERETVSVNVAELLKKYDVGQVVEGLVSGIADFGIFVRFVDTPEIEGLVHISEIDHRIIDNPKETVRMSEAVKIKILDIKDGKVFLSLKALKADPWTTASELYRAGDTVSGTVYKFNPFGAVVNLDGGLQGMIHVSEFGGTDEMKKALTIGAKHSFVVDSVKLEEKRVVLKVKK